MLPPKTPNGPLHRVGEILTRRPTINPDLLRPSSFLRPGPQHTGEGRNPRDRADRLTPFLVLLTSPTDMGETKLRRIPHGSPTLMVSRAETPGFENGFELNARHSYRISGEVTNRGTGTALCGIAKLYILHGTELTKLWGKPFGDFFDITDFTAWPKRSVPLRFNRVWIPDQPRTPLDGRVTFFIHVIDLTGDSIPFTVGDSGDRRFIRQDYHLA